MCVGTLKTESSYLYDHSIEVAIHSALLARRLGFHPSEIREIVLGALLHDIGYLFIPEDLTKKRGKLSEAEIKILQRHTFYGYWLLKEREEISLLSAHVAYQHHERQDGTGFPRGLRGNNRIVSKEEALKYSLGMIHRYANVVAVPNYYDSLVSSLPYKKALGPDEAIRMVREASGEMLNAQVANVFLSYMPVYPLGTNIIVINGRYAGYKGFVVKVKPSELDKPLIRLTFEGTRKLKNPIDIDLTKEDLVIRAIWS
jgi:HD-GYP domain-containing protein (c-di-GMP phosphodiesterase class II)